MSAELIRRSMTVSVDGSSPDSVTVKGNQLDVDNRMYLGGLPHTFTTRRINVRHFSVHTVPNLQCSPTHRCCPPPYVSQASSSFPGCVRAVSLNGALMDLSKPSSQHDVTDCFTKDQAGSYFNGSGYAVLSESIVLTLPLNRVLPAHFLTCVCVCACVQCMMGTRWAQTCPWLWSFERANQTQCFWESAAPRSMPSGLRCSVVR